MPIEPAARITALRAFATVSPCPCDTNARPVARRRPSLSSRTSFVACAFVITVRLGRPDAGRSHALVALQRRPRFWFMWK